MTVLTLLVGVLLASSPVPTPSCPFLADADARRALGGEISLVVADFDGVLDGASSCRFARLGGSPKSAPGRLVIAELGVASSIDDPFAPLRPKQLAQLEVSGARWSVLLPAGSLRDTDAWYRGLAGLELPSPEAVVLLWSDEDGFETAVLLDAPGRDAEALYTELTRLARLLARTP